MFNDVKYRETFGVLSCTNDCRYTEFAASNGKIYKRQALQSSTQGAH
jgi:hypothetical protein